MHRAWDRRFRRWQPFLGLALGMASLLATSPFAYGEMPPATLGADAPAKPGFDPLRDARGAWTALADKQNQLTLAIFTVGVVGAHQVDPQFRDYFARGRRVGDLDRLGNEVLGTGIPGALLGAGLWLDGANRNSGGGDGNKNSHEIHAGQAQLESLAGTAVVTFALKGTVRRDRPDGSDQYSFPSGHTSTMAASAMSLQEFYGWKAGAPMFALTALTAASRMTADVHWFSDTVAGAGVGVLVGHAFSQAHLSRLEGGAPTSAREEAGSMRSRTVFLPLFSPGSAELIATTSF